MGMSEVSGYDYTSQMPPFLGSISDIMCENNTKAEVSTLFTNTLSFGAAFEKII